MPTAIGSDTCSLWQTGGFMRSYENGVSKDSDYYIYTASQTAQNLFFYPTYIGNFQYLPGYSLKRTSYDSFLIMMITDGNCKVTANGETYHASKETIVLIDCYSPHQYETETGWSALWIHFDGPLSRAYYNQIVSTIGMVFFHHNFHGIHYILEKIYQVFKQGKPVSEPQVSSMITSMLNDILTYKENLDIASSFLKDTITYINEHFAEKITLEDLAAKASLSPFYFTRVFAKETGMTPHQYLIATRLSFARLLLKTTDFSIKEIAFRCGFSDEGRFCSSFKKREHMTPSQYRRK